MSAARFDGRKQRSSRHCALRMPILTDPCAFEGNLCKLMKAAAWTLTSLSKLQGGQWTHSIRIELCLIVFGFPLERRHPTFLFCPVFLFCIHKTKRCNVQCRNYKFQIQLIKRIHFQRAKKKTNEKWENWRRLRERNANILLNEIKIYETRIYARKL